VFKLISTLFINFNAILPSTSRFSKWSFCFRFLNQILFEFFFPSQSPCSDHPHKIQWAVHIMKLLIMQFSPFSCHLIFFNPSHLPQCPILKHPRPMFQRQCKKLKDFNEIKYLLHKLRNLYSESTRWRIWLMNCATRRKVAVSIPDGVIGIFY